MASTHVSDVETAHRTRVALWLADVILAHTDTTADAIEAAAGLTDAGWRLVVSVARADHPEWKPAAGYCPSPPTRSAVITVLQQQDGDPFRGFPTT